MNEPKVENMIEKEPNNTSVVNEEPANTTTSSLEAQVQPTDLASDELIAKLLQDEFNVEYELKKKSKSSIESLALEKSSHPSSASSLNSQIKDYSSEDESPTSMIKKGFLSLYAAIKKAPKLYASKEDVKSRGLLSGFRKTSMEIFSTGSSPLNSPIIPFNGDFTKDEFSMAYDNYQTFIALMCHPQAVSIIRFAKNFANEFNHASNVSLKKQIEAYFEFTKFLYRRIQNLELGRESFILKDTDLLVEGIERYMTSKISIKAFCPTDSDDAAIDAEISNNLLAFKWIKEEHLDLSPLDSDFHYEEARKILANINHVPSPIEKVQCIVTSGRLLFKWLRDCEAGADDLFPRLVFLIIKSNIQRLHSNLEYIKRYRNPGKLVGEIEYHLTNLDAALSFIRQLSRETLTITDEAYLMLTRESLSSSSAPAVQVTSHSYDVGTSSSTYLSNNFTHDLLAFHSLPNLNLLEAESESFENLNLLDTPIPENLNETPKDE